MKHKTLLFVGFLALVATNFAIAESHNLWEFYKGHLPTLQARSIIYQGISDDTYVGSATQNQRLLKKLTTGKTLGSLASPSSTVEGTSTAGWTDDGSVVRLNTAADSVGIGTSNPAEKLTVKGGNASISGTLTVLGGTVSLGSNNGTSTLTIANGGNLGIGTTSPNVALEVHGSSLFAGTTTTGSLIVASSSIMLNGVNYILPANFGSANQFLQTNGAGVTIWATPVITGTGDSLLDASTTLVAGTSGASTTIYSYVVPANTLSTGNSIHGVIPFSSFICTSSKDGIEIAYGAATTTVFADNEFGCSIPVTKLEFWLTAGGTTATQKLTGMFNVGSTTNPAATNFGDKIGSSNVNQDSTLSKRLMVVVKNGTTIPVQAILNLLRP